MVPSIRIQSVNDAGVQADGQYVLYWMTGARRVSWNYGLDRALEWATEHRKPIVVLEAVRVGYRWASDRLHRFILDGMRDHLDAGAESPWFYYPYVERVEGEGSGLLETLARDAVVVVTDDFPCFFLPRMIAAAGKKLSVRLEKVDSNGLLPMRSTDRVFPTAYAFRRFLQEHLPARLCETPAAHPGKNVDLPAATLPAAIFKRWPRATKEILTDPATLSAAPIDHTIKASSIQGGPNAAALALRDFLRRRLSQYADERNQPELSVASGLSPYLHFGHLSVHQVFAELSLREEWNPQKLSASTRGQREGWWGMSPSSESFLDEIVTWRELGYNFCSHRCDYDQYESLPEWAAATLAEHERDRRPHLYSLEQLEKGRTHDRLWNATQGQLIAEGRIHNYLRMLWGKKILQWSRTPREALSVLIELNNKYALDGRNPNSYSGIFWCLGRYDRPWGPERPIFGKIRYMSSENTARKVRVQNYIERYSPTSEGSLFD